MKEIKEIIDLINSNNTTNNSELNINQLRDAFNISINNEDGFYLEKYGLNGKEEEGFIFEDNVWYKFNIITKEIVSFGNKNIKYKKR